MEFITLYLILLIITIIKKTIELIKKSNHPPSFLRTRMITTTHSIAAFAYVLYHFNTLTNAFFNYVFSERYGNIKRWICGKIIGRYLFI